MHTLLMWKDLTVFRERAVFVADLESRVKVLKSV